MLFAWSGLGAAFAPVILGMLFDKKMNHTGAVAGMFGGFATTVVWVVWLKETALDLYEMIPGLLVGLVLAFAASRIGRAPRPDN